MKRPSSVVILGSLFALFFVLTLISVSSAVQSAGPAMLTERPSFLGYNAYFGELHQHTGYSSEDACGLPEEAITAGKNRGNDFMAFTEHHNTFNDSAIGAISKGCRISQTDPHKWETQGQLAERYTHDGSFILLRGYEYTVNFGHLNVFNSEVMYPPQDTDEFYSWLAGQPQDVFAQFNHPLAYELGGEWQGDFNGFDFFPPAATKVRLIETALKPPYYLSYPRALGAEWQVSPVGYADHHRATEAGTKRGYGVFAPALTRADLIEALRNGRTFGNSDNHLAVALLGNDQWMGTATSAETISFRGYAADWGEDTISLIELVGRAGVIASWEPQTNPAECTYTVHDVQPGDFFYLHVVDSSGGEAWSGSITKPLYRRLQANPTTLRFSFQSIAESAVAQSFVLEANDGEDMPWQASSQADWLEVYPSEGMHLPAVITVTVQPAQLVDGITTSGVVIQSLEQDHTPIVVGVQAEMGTTQWPTLGLSPRNADLVTSIEVPLASMSISVSPTVSNAVWFARTTVPWLSVTPDTGSGEAIVHLTVDMAGRSSSLYMGHVVVTCGAQLRVVRVNVAHRPVNARMVTLQDQPESGGYTGVSDTFLNGWEPSTSFGRNSQLRVRSDEGGIKVPLLRFDLTQLPQTSEVCTATLGLYVKERSVPSAMLLQPYELLKPWDEASATWTNSQTGVRWAADGAQKRCEDTACQPFAIVGVNHVGQWVLLDVTSMVRKWVAYPESNFGLSIVGSAEANMELVIVSSDAPTEASFRPYLSIVYGDPAPTPTPTATASPTATSTQTATATASATLSPTPSPTATATPSPRRPSYLPLILRG